MAAAAAGERAEKPPGAEKSPLRRGIDPRDVWPAGGIGRLPGPPPAGVFESSRLEESTIKEEFFKLMQEIDQNILNEQNTFTESCKIFHHFKFSLNFFKHIKSQIPVVKLYTSKLIRRN